MAGSVTIKNGAYGSEDPELGLAGTAGEEMAHRWHKAAAWSPFVKAPAPVLIYSRVAMGTAEGGEGWRRWLEGLGREG
uniref:Uncharacterized protein n=1 Tax=Oryza nivara TaxID=4536 RepID=A0A0E0HRL9_ORYNI